MSAAIPPPSSYAPPALITSVTADTVLEACAVHGMVGVLHQLGELANRAHDIFAALAEDTGRSAARVAALQVRLAASTSRLARVDDALQAANAEELSEVCNAAPGMEYKAVQEEQSGLFTAASRPSVLHATFAAARAPPQLYLLDSFAARAEGRYAKYGLTETCANNYSDKDFFVKQWLDEEERKVNALKAVGPANPMNVLTHQHADSLCTQNRFTPLVASGEESSTC